MFFDENKIQGFVSWTKKIVLRLRIEVLVLKANKKLNSLVKLAGVCFVPILKQNGSRFKLWHFSQIYVLKIIKKLHASSLFITLSQKPSFQIRRNNFKLLGSREENPFYIFDIFCLPLLRREFILLVCVNFQWETKGDKS